MFVIYRTSRSVRLSRYEYRAALHRSIRQHIGTYPKELAEFPVGSEAWSADERAQFQQEVLDPNLAALRVVRRLPASFATAKQELACGHASEADVSTALTAALDLVKALLAHQKRGAL
jgi:hypothetical protein